jgi:hypothetical protein
MSWPAATTRLIQKPGVGLQWVPALGNDRANAIPLSETWPYMAIVKGKPAQCLTVSTLCTASSSIQKFSVYLCLLWIWEQTAFLFQFPVPLFSWRSSNSWLRLLPRLPVTYILPLIFHSITCFRRQFLRQMWPIQLAFLLFTVCRIFLSFPPSM